MTPGGGRFLFWVTLGMELCWLYAGAAYLTTAILSRPFPFPEAIGTFLLAVILTLLSKGKGWRVISILAIQIAGLLLAALRMAYAFHDPSGPFWHSAWLADFLHTPRSSLEWLSLIYVLIWVLLFWISGVTLARRSSAHATLCSRFDIGIAAFLVLFLIQLLLWAKGEIRIDCPASQMLVFPFFIFSFLAIGRVRNRGTAHRNFLPGYQAIGVIIGFTLTVFLFGAGLVLFFLPYLTMSAEAGYVALKTAARPLGYIFVAIIRFLYMRNVTRPETSSSSSSDPGLGDLASSTPKGWWTELLEKILGYAMGIAIGLLVLLFAGLIFYYLTRWLLSRTGIAPQSESPFSFLPRWLEKVRVFLSSLWPRIQKGINGYQRAGQFYGALRQWGRRSGLPHFPSETPREYGLRLEHRFPQLKREIARIVEGFHQEVYAEIPLERPQLAAAQDSWRKLRSPRLWPSRLRTCLLKREDSY